MTLSPEIDFKSFFSTLDIIVFSLIMALTFGAVVWGHLRHGRGEDGILDHLLMGRTLTMPLAPGQPLGLWPNLLLDERVVALPPGATLLLYSDGLTDARNAEEEAFGHERVLARLASLAGQPAGAVCEALWRDVLDHRGDRPAYDDLTLVAVSTSPESPGGLGARNRPEYTHKNLARSVIASEAKQSPARQ